MNLFNEHQNENQVCLLNTLNILNFCNQYFVTQVVLKFWEGHWLTRFFKIENIYKKVQYKLPQNFSRRLQLTQQSLDFQLPQIFEKVIGIGERAGRGSLGKDLKKIISSSKINNTNMTELYSNYLYFYEFKYLKHKSTLKCQTIYDNKGFVFI